jgi:hypothetical protein
MTKIEKSILICDEVFEEVTEKVISIYNQASIPTINPKSVKEKMKMLWKNKK